ncbi:MAG: lipopolysaccharide assembly protein LapA domain-containing protein [Novosphingobium sp.]|nr:lipopolysaccharide assembly protein LapA domain-containing protein [Novosphingobium sp.]
MAIVRTIIWVLVTIVLVLFTINNWQPVEVRIWNSLILETKLPALVVLAFLLGLVPMWLVHRAARWRQTRRIAQLEANLARPTAAPELPPAPAPPPPATPPVPAEPPV